MSRWARRRMVEGVEPENPDALQKTQTDAAELANHAGSLAAVAREEAELKAMLWNAHQRPRDEQEARRRLLASCKRLGFADGATYSFPRGNQKINGPGVVLAREAARCWGNVRYGVRIVSADDEWVQIKGFAFDLETNVYVDAEDKFRRRIQRKNRDTGETRWVEPDERDLRELVNRRAAICIRNAILQLIPGDIIDDAMEVAADTLEAVAKNDLSRSREEAISDLVDAFDEFAVTPAMLQHYLGHPLAVVTPQELTDLRQVWASIRDGNSTREDYFDVKAATAGPATVQAGGANPSTRTREVLEKLKGAQAAPEGHSEQGGDQLPSDGADPASPADEQPGPAGEPGPRQSRPQQPQRPQTGGTHGSSGGNGGRASRPR